MTATPKDFLNELFQVAINAAQAQRAMPAYLPSPPSGKTYVIGAGKAAAAMAQTFEQHWQGPLHGLVVTRYGHAVPCDRIEVIEASHPVPDTAAQDAAQRVLALVQQATEDDLVVTLISGGGSSLLTLPLPGIALTDKQQLSRELLRSGATIQEINCVRRHLSAIKGGRLAQACYPARVINLMISDVPGDDPTDIASGPTVPDPTESEDARAMRDRYRITVPDAVTQCLNSAAAESVKPGAAELPRIDTHIIATASTALQAAQQHAEAAGIPTLILGEHIEGEARDVAKVLAGISQQIQHGNGIAHAPCLLLSGGETTVSVRGNGRGGRNVELSLALALALRGTPGIHALAGDTDGIDGIDDNAGAYISPDTLQRAEQQGLHPQAYLDNNDAHSFFSAIGDSVVTGPTLTNVNDFRAILIQ
ncbi:MAG TPA: glycerate kinase [Gammaproteobacteria bacterium]|nr:glycerate kinase [Gammaproteobacteria bacterium]